MAASRTLRNVSFFLLALVLVSVSILTFMSSHVTQTLDELSFAARYHTEIMVVLLILSLAFGFASSQLFYRELQRKSKDTHGMLQVVLLFLSQEEREIVNFLVEKKGQTTQAEIARLPHMNRVKAYRSLQKMQQKQIIDLVAHGKVRKVRLKENILSLLLED